MRRAFAAAISLSLIAAPALAQSITHAPPGHGYKRVSDLVKLPEFLLGLGALYVAPSTLPAGPFLAYDHQGRLVSTIYMIPIKDINALKTFDALLAPGGRVDHVSLY